MPAGMLGLTLMLGYLGADGFTSTFQDKLFRGYQMSAFNQMLYINTFSSVISAVGARCCLLYLYFKNFQIFEIWHDLFIAAFQCTENELCWSRPADIGANGPSAGLCSTASAGAAVRILAFTRRNCWCVTHDVCLLHLHMCLYAIFCNHNLCAIIQGA